MSDRWGGSSRPPALALDERIALTPPFTQPVSRRTRARRFQTPRVRSRFDVLETVLQEVPQQGLLAP